MEDYHKTSENEKKDYIIRMWTKKECLFKLLNSNSKIKSLKQLDGDVYFRKINIDNQEYYISLASNNLNKINLYEVCLNRND